MKVFKGKDKVIERIEIDNNSVTRIWSHNKECYFNKVTIRCPMEYDKYIKPWNYVMENNPELKYTDNYKIAVSMIGSYFYKMMKR